MDIAAAELIWPDRPYRGLDYYSEADASLFRERDDEVRRCTRILHGFGLKILLLHGSSGSGKSSFLRAGLIPALKQDRRSAVFFLAGYDSVIRATADPLSEIARVVLAALRSPQVFADGVLVPDDAAADDSPLHVAEATRATISRSLEQALDAPRRELGKALIGALGRLCAGLPGRLVLVLDQAEEVLTRTADGLAEAKAAAFFRFIEDIYIRNLDIRLIVTLRTEYYGRFRDELRISDDRLGDRPSKGGIEQFLLRSLRDKDALVRIIEAPTLAQQADGAPLFGFWFEGVPSTGGEQPDQTTLPSRIADELLIEFPASVTPALQVICACLHQRLPAGSGPITHAAYAATGGVRKIILRYIENGIQAAGASRAAEIANWQRLLHSLVSRQGGGTVVSLTEQGCELERRARRLGIAGDIGAKLIALTAGTEPLLKGEPWDAPTSFSLKHDMLAVILSRWNDEYSGASEIRAHERRKRNRIFVAGGLAILLVGCTSAALVGSRTYALAQAEAANIRLKNTYAEKAPNGDFRRSLLLLLANLKATSAPRGVYDWIFAAHTTIHDETASALRRFLPRAPWFSGEYAAVGLDPGGGALAALRNGVLTVISLPKNGVAPAATPISYRLVPPPSAPGPGGRMQYAAGFVTGLGPAAVVNDTVYFWPDGKQAEVRHLPVRRTEGTFPPRIDFIGGRLQIMWRFPSQPLHILRLDADALRQSDDDLAKRVEVASARQVQAKGGWGRPMAVLSEAVNAPQRYGTLEEVPRPGPQADEPGEAQLSIGSLDGGALVRLAVEARQASQEASGRYDTTLAFVANADALAVKKDGPGFDIHDLASRHAGTSSEGPAAFRVTIDGADEAAWRLGQAGNPFQYPPLAVVRMGRHWRAAGLGTKGVWVVESTDGTPDHASLILGGQLPGGDEGGAKLQFTADGEYLMLVQQRQFGRSVTVRLWDLRQVWRDWLDPPAHAAAPGTAAADMATVEVVACRIVRDEPKGSALDPALADLFQIAPAFRDPCSDVKDPRL